MKLFALKHIKVGPGPESYYPGGPNGDEFETDAETAKGLLEAGVATRDDAERVEVVDDAPPAPTRIEAAPKKAPAKTAKRR